MWKSFASGALAVAVGCSGGEGRTTEPPPPQLKPAIGSIALTTDRAFLYIKHPAALADVVAHVYDINGVEIPKADLHFGAQVPSGWTVGNDSIVPPSTEQRAPITVTATYKVPTVSAERAPAGLTPSFSRGSASTPVVTTDVVVDLRLTAFTIPDFKCTASKTQPSVAYYDSTGGQFRIDSIAFAGAVVDSIGTGASSVYSFGTKPPYSALFYRATATFFLETGGTVTKPFISSQQITGQAPDSIVTESGLLVKTSAALAPAVYDANVVTLGNAAGFTPATLCSSSWAVRAPLILRGSL